MRTGSLLIWPISPNPPRLDENRISLHFDMTLGWGHWQHILCSVDYKTTVYPLEEKNEENEK